MLSSFEHAQPEGHTVLWVGMGKGVVEASSEGLEHG
jgi:hypothetical protein